MQITKPLINLINNPKFSEFTQNTSSAVAVETTLKAIGRPSFIFIDKNADEDTKKYSASKEFLYQILCLSLYLTLIPFFKRAGFAAFKKIFKDKDDFKKIQDIKFGDYIKDKSKMPPLVKGSIELSSIIGSAISLTIIAPQVINWVIHPLMNVFGIKKAEKTVTDPPKNALNNLV